MKKEIDEQLGLLEKAMCELPYESAAYYIINSFMHIKKPSDDLKKMFQAWIILPQGETENELALHRRFFKMIEEESRPNRKDE